MGPISKVILATALVLPIIMTIAASAEPMTPDTAPQSTAPTITADGRVVVPERLPVKVSLDQDLKSGSDKAGEEIQYDLVNDLYTVDRQLIAPAGTHAYGKVLASSGHGMFGKPGKLQISCDYLLAPDHTHIPLRGNQIGNGGKNEVGGMVALTLFVSVLGVFVNGRDVNLHRGLEITMYVDHDTPASPYLSTLAPTTSATSKMLYTMNDGTQVVGTQSAFDGTSYAVTTDSGLKLIKASDIKGRYQISDAPLPASAPTSPVALSQTQLVSIPAAPVAPTVLSATAPVLPQGRSAASALMAPAAAPVVPQAALPVPPTSPTVPAKPATPPAPLTTPAALSTRPQVMHFVLKNGSVYEGPIARHDAANGFYYVTVPMGTKLIKQQDVATMTPLPPAGSSGSK